MDTAQQAPLRRFIVFEGGDGTGTTTQLSLLTRAFEKAGLPHWTTSEPTDNPEGRLIRRILSGELPRDPGTLARLFAADRNEHLRGSGGILSRLERGDIVVCDRYVLSSLVYQGLVCGPELPAQLNSAFPLPELLIYFDLAPEEAIRRLGERKNLDIYEELPFQQRVRAAYRAALAGYASTGMRIQVIDASRPVQEIHASIRGAIGSLGISLPDDS
jgi:dTMP kinase